MRKTLNSLMPTASWLGNVKSAAIVLLVMLFSSATAWAADKSGKCGDNLTWEFTKKDSTLTIKGTGEMKAFRNKSDAPWYSYRPQIKKVILQEGVTNISTYAFYLFSHLKEITIPASVSTIGNYAFQYMGRNISGGCTLTVDKGSKLNKIGTYAFQYFRGKTDLHECTKLTVINNYAFQNYNSGTIQLPLSLETIESRTFDNAKPTEVTVAYNNGILYVNGKEVDSSAEYKEYNIKSYLDISSSGSKEVTFSRISFDGIPLSFDETDKSFVISNEQELIEFCKIRANSTTAKADLKFKLTADLDFTNMPINYYNDDKTISGNFVPYGDEYNAFYWSFDGQGHRIKGLKYSGGNYLGLFCNIVDKATVKNVTLINPNFSGDTNLGGIAGYNSGTITECTVIAPSINGNSYLSGIAGKSSGGTITNCTVIAPSISNKGSYIGCIAGESNARNVIRNCYYDISTGLYYDSNNFENLTFNGNKPLLHLNLAYGITSSQALTFGDYTMAQLSKIVTLEANRAGYEFVEFKSEEVTIEDGQFTMPKKNVSVTAVWEPMTEIILKGSMIDGLNWTTFYCGDAGYSIADGEEACAYTATVGDDVITLHLLGKVIPKGTAVIIVGEDDEISMTRDDVSAAEYSVKNDLRGVDEPTLRTSLTSNDTKMLYMLSNKNNNFGFHSFGATNVPARKAYFTISSSANARPFSMVFEDDATAARQLLITNDELPVYDSSIYDLNGRKVSGNNLKAGVYVKGGKKIVIK